MKDVRSIKDDLNLMQTAYSVALVLGFRNIVESFYDIGTNIGFTGRIPVIKLISGILLMITMVRFFWAVGNIRRFIARNNTGLKDTRRYVVSFHFFVLLLHAFALFALAKFSLEITAQSDVDYTVRFFIFGYAGFLLFNSSWLTILVWGKSDKYPEKTWIFNNVITSSVAIVIYAAVCIWSDSCFIGFLSTVPVFLINCLVDIVKTASSYVTVDEEKKEGSQAN